MKNIIDWTRRRICWNTHIWNESVTDVFSSDVFLLLSEEMFRSSLQSSAQSDGAASLFWRSVLFIRQMFWTHTEFPSSPLCRSRSPTNTRNKMYIFEHKLRTFTKRKQVVFVPEPDKTEPVYYHHLDDITHLTSSFLHVQIHSNFNSKNSSLHFGTKTSRRVDFQSLTTAVWAFRTLYCSELQRWSKRIKASICQESNTLSIQKWMM